MHIVNGVELEISIEALKKLTHDMKYNNQELKFYNHLFAEGNVVSVFVSGCPALILANITVKQYTDDVWGEFSSLVIDGENTQTEFIEIEYINNQPGFSAQCILKTYFLQPLF
eukprot:TRINITY_DN4871_c0_g1_i1.p1 TRINITY_DN4871_c0_g1~~TRINITY_DN4871_c0_g1_i1.p1  ORF type:complete len:131 (-),score=27.74 TRINITY_DN4871_c0_g1_i1:73-411(-)